MVGGGSSRTTRRESTAAGPGAFGGLTPVRRRTPEDCARIASFRVLEEPLHLLDQLRRRIEQGEHVILLERDHVREKGRLVIELVIEGNP